MQKQTGIDLHIPASVAEALRLPEAGAELAIRRELAVALYREGLLSFGKARELADLDKAAFGHLLGERGIVRHYGAREVAEDLRYATGDDAA
jgi:predicted HTH domain antitoxin